jgi:hypothetical protein
MIPISKDPAIQMFPIFLPALKSRLGIRGMHFSNTLVRKLNSESLNPIFMPVSVRKPLRSVEPTGWCHAPKGGAWRLKSFDGSLGKAHTGDSSLQTVI